MVRRLVETLIIECFEANKITEKIKSSDGHFVSLEHLIKKFLEEDWNLSRNGKKDLKKIPELKYLGDISAHNRYYLASKSDIDQVKSHTRLIIQELFTISQGV
ncbi:hypothetical protein [Microcoleus sp.]|uniref:hypothetical protein n=1 Tax=Microcoleus sp. TaxID=44472 RepID=UPI0035269206